MIVELILFYQAKDKKYGLNILSLLPQSYEVVICYIRVDFARLGSPGFLLLSAALFYRSNRGLYDWLLQHPRLGPYIQNFMVHKTIPVRIKVLSISMVWLTLLNCAIFVSTHWAMRLFFIVLAIAITLHISSYKSTP